MTEETFERLRGTSSLGEIDRILADEDVRAVPLLVAGAIGGLLIGVLQATSELLFEVTANASLVAVSVAVSVAVVCAGLLGIMTGAATWLTMVFVRGGIDRQRALRRLDVEAWRPRVGARHPRGRIDTEPRWILERRIDGSTVEIGLRRWTYGRVWDRDDRLLAARRFTADELDAADAYASDDETLVAAAEREMRAPKRLTETSDDERLERGAERLLGAWVSEREEHRLLTGEPR